MTIGRIGRCILFASALAAPGSLEAQLCDGELCPGRIWNPPALAWDQQVVYVPTRDEYFITTTEWTGSAGGLSGRMVSVDGALTGGVIPLLAGGGSGVTGSAMAYNPHRNEILLITRDASPTAIRAMFLGADGQPISGVFDLGSGDAPHVAYSPQSQRYLVTWSRRVANVFYTFYALINGDSTSPAPVLAGGTIDSNALSDVLAYSTVSGKFLVVYTKDLPPPRRADIYGRFVAADGTLGAVFPIDTTVDNQQLPRITYSATHDRFLVSYEDWSESGGWSANATASLLDANGGLIRRFHITRTNAWDIPGPMAYSTTAQSFLVSWRTATNNATVQYAQELGPDGTPKAAPVFVSGFDIGLMAIDTRNHLTDPKALILWRNVFGDDGVHAGVFDFVTPITTVLNVDAPATNTGVLQPFSISGFAIDPGAPTGTGVDVVHVWGYPAAGGSVFLGSAAYGGSRPDVATAYGDARFTNSGFTLNVDGIANGSYTVRVYARSTLTGNFDVFKNLSITIGPDPRMNVEAPAAGATVSAPFEVRGWALDRAANGGTGVDAVHVWAFPAGGAPGTFLGAATYGGSRPDVAATFGNGFQNSGFTLLATKALPAGDYTLQVWARSTVTGTFSNSMNVPVKVVGVNHLNVDTPLHGGGVGGSFVVSGWALNTGSAAGSGIDAVHVWAISTANGAATFLGPATLGISRPDVASYFGDARFDPSGYRLEAGPLAPGSYVLRIYARNAASGQFEISRDVLVNTVGSSPLAVLDAPAPGNVSLPFVVSGWSVDLNASSGTGIDVIHIWASPSNGGAPVFLGSANMGISRPDVAAYFSKPGFGTAGYNLTVNALASGTYTVVVWSRSTLSGAFTAAPPVVINVP